MAAWWNGLSLLNQVFWGGVVFFSTLFGWQLVASFAGLGGGAGEVDAEMDVDVDVDVDADVDAGTIDGDLTEDIGGLATFRLLSVRSVLAFGTLFSWAGALYLQRDTGVVNSLLVAVVWGLIGMLVVAAFFWLLPRLTEEGNLKLSATVNKTATVYIRIPADGVGQVRVIADGRLSYLRARSADGVELQAGTSVVVRGVGTDGILSVSDRDGIAVDKGE